MIPFIPDSGSHCQKRISCRNQKEICTLKTGNDLHNSTEVNVLTPLPCRHRNAFCHIFFSWPSLAGHIMAFGMILFIPSHWKKAVVLFEYIHLGNNTSEEVYLRKIYTSELSSSELSSELFSEIENSEIIIRRYSVVVARRYLYPRLEMSVYTSG